MAIRIRVRALTEAHDLYLRLFGDLPYLVEGCADADAARAGVFVDELRSLSASVRRHRTEVARRLGTGSSAPAAPGSELDRCLERAQACAAAWAADPGAATRRRVVEELVELPPALAWHFAGELDRWRRQGPPEGEPAYSVSLPARAAMVRLGWLLDGRDAWQRRAILAGQPVRTRVRWHAGGARRWHEHRDRLLDLVPG